MRVFLLNGIHKARLPFLHTPANKTYLFSDSLFIFFSFSWLEIEYRCYIHSNNCVMEIEPGHARHLGASLCILRAIPFPGFVTCALLHHHHHVSSILGRKNSFYLPFASHPIAHCSLLDFVYFLREGKVVGIVIAVVGSWN